MRLKSIKLAGFKSFVDSTTIPFPSNLCCVVGPNGCGKSNIIDAVRWVMGESSAKTLRGESMTDVIFNGSNARKPVAQASIELVFDNSDGSIGGQYAAFGEIAIRRKVTRDAQSDYFLNGVKCRRRDIVDIFLGTGLGSRSYSIIEQGMISRLVDAKPDELRVYLEEAAGISKYKERRRETENRIRRTQENLDRVNDLRDELDRQLQRLQRQADAAKKYRVLQAEQHKQEAEVQALHWRELNIGFQQKEKDIQQLDVQLEAFIADQRSADAGIEKQRDQHTTLQDGFNSIQGDYYSLGANIARIEQSISHAKERSKQLSEDISRTQHSWQETQQHLEEDQHSIISLTSEVGQIKPELDVLTAAEQQVMETLHQAEQSMQSWQSDWDDFNQQSAEAQRQSEVAKSQIIHAEQLMHRLHENNKRLEQQQAQLASNTDANDIVSQRERYTVLAEDLASDKNNLTQLIEQINQQRLHNQQLTIDVDIERSKLQTMLSQQASLTALQDAVLGESNEQIDQWLQQQNMQGLPRLIENLTVEPGWDKAVETVLSKHLYSIGVDRIDDLITSDLANLFDKGSLSLIELTSGQSNEKLDNQLIPLVSKVVCQWDLTSLLCDIFVADDLAAANALRQQLLPHQTVVTKQGIWLGVNWLKLEGGSSKEEGVLQRKKQLIELAEKITVQEEAVLSLQKILEGGVEYLQTSEQSRDELQQTLSEKNRQLGELKVTLMSQEENINQLSNRLTQVKSEISDNNQQLVKENQLLSETRQLLGVAETRVQGDADKRNQLLLERDKHRETLQSAREAAGREKDKTHQLALRFQDLQTQLQGKEQNMSRLQIQVQRLEEQHLSLKQSAENTDSPVEDLDEQLEVELEKRLLVEKQLIDARQQLENLDHSLRQLEQQRLQAEQNAQSVRDQIQQERMRWQELQVRCKTIEEQLAAKEVQLSDVLASLLDDAEIEAWEEELRKINSRIQRLGAINLAAIDEYQVQSERKTYLDEQHADLSEALATLENAIRKIDKETRSRFKETFDQVNTGLNELFPKVFGGGHAYLEMTEDDVLNTGITLMARPPGKRNSTIHLLSGGEKALTALALIFSIFQLNPAPFCMLDEVDAPLDDVNVGRYCRMLREMSGTVQFIYITHNKISMEMAHHLMGVTMHEAGVSRLVSVDIDAAAEMAG